MHTGQKKKKGKDTSVKKKDMRAIQSNVGKDLFFYFWQVVCNKLRKQRLKKKKEKAVATI